MIFLRPYFMDKPIGQFTYRIDEVSFNLVQILTLLMVNALIGRFVYIIVTGVCSGYVEMVKEVEKARAFWNRNQTTAVADAETRTKPLKMQQDAMIADMQLRTRQLDHRVSEIERKMGELERAKSEVLEKKKAQEMHRKQAEAEKMDHVLIERKDLVGWAA